MRFKTFLSPIHDTPGMRNELLVETQTLFDQLRQSFSRLRPIRDDYPLVPIEHGFNWHACMSGLHIPSLYLVVFRSIRRADADLHMLKRFDDRAFEDAQAAPGFLFYFKGQITPARECLSFCLWGSREQARTASARPDHVAAANLVADMYESYDLERHAVKQQRGMLVFERLTG